MSAPGCQISSKSDCSGRSYDVISIFKLSAATAKFYFRFLIRWRLSFQSVNLYQQTKFHRDISMHGWCMIISDSSAVLQLYYRFRFQPYACYSASDCQFSSKSEYPRRSYDVIALSIFKLTAATAQFYFRFRIWWHLSFQKVRSIISPRSHYSLTLNIS